MSNIKVDRESPAGGSIKSALLHSWWWKNTLEVTEHPDEKTARITIKGSMRPRIVEWADLKEWAEALVAMAEEQMNK